MLTGPQQKFCEGVISGLNATDAYVEAFPKASRRSADANATRLMGKDGIKAEIRRLRALAQEKAGSALMTLIEKRTYLARVVRCELGERMPAPDLIQSIEVEKRKDGDDWLDIHKVRVCDKLAAIKLDNDLAGEGSEATANGSMAEFIASLRK